MVCQERLSKRQYLNACPQKHLNQNRFPAPAAAPTIGSGSFLDEWLAKQKSVPAPTHTPTTPTQNQPVENQSQPQPTVGTEAEQSDEAVAPQEDAKVAQVANYESGNVSSAELDQQEVKDIAAELKKGLKSVEGSVDIQDSTKAQTAPVTLQPQNHTESTQPGEDTIVIDSDGTIHMRNPSEDE